MVKLFLGRFVLIMRGIGFPVILCRGNYYYKGMSAFNRFKEQVLKAYWEKHSNNELHDRLANPTSANLRDYALFLLGSGLNPDDKKTLRDFFILKDEHGDLEKSIAGIDIDKLKPVRYFIDKKTNNPDETIVKLLAVLIDFQPRPFRIDDWTENPTIPFTSISKPTVLENDRSGKSQDLEPQAEPESIESPKPVDYKRKGSKLNKKAVLLVSSGGIIAASLGYIGFKEKKECMCWFKDQYIVVDCINNNLRNKNVIALDQDKLDNFKKITRYDTLGIKDVNKIWYSKVNNEVEFFTEAGKHPEHAERGLKLATEYIIRKYAMGENTESTEKTGINNSE